MRLQLTHAHADVLSPQLYNQLFTMHGVTMLFLFALPMLSGFSNYLWPLMIGARDMAFPRVNAVGYWLFLAAGIFLYTSFPLGSMPNAGWFNYVPLASSRYLTGPNIDFFALGMLFLGISTTAGAINFVVTFFKMRAPGMSLDRMPILLWGTATASVSILFALPVTHRRLPVPVSRPPFRDALLRPRARRTAAALAAPVLDLRSPVGLHHRAAGHEPGVGHDPHLLPPSAGGLQYGRVGHGGRGDSRVRRVGAPHVRHRAVAGRALLLQRREHGDRDSQRRVGVRVDRHHLAGPAPSSARRSCSSSASSSCSSSAG